MAKKKPSGLHKSPRQAVQLPKTWIAVARKLAMKRQQPMMWHIVSLIGEAATKEGIELPPYPWEEELVFDQNGNTKK